MEKPKLLQSEYYNPFQHFCNIQQNPFTLYECVDNRYNHTFVISKVLTATWTVPSISKYFKIYCVELMGENYIITFTSQNYAQDHFTMHEWCALKGIR